MHTTIDGPGLSRAVTDLRSALETTRLPLETPRVGADRTARRELIAQLDDYVLPRLEALDAPLLAVIGGSTGAGKSTLVNSVIGHEVTRAGVLRPTTRASVLIHHPADAGWFTTERVLPGLRRLTGAGDADDPSSLRLVSSDSIPAGLALLDAPDIDSVVAANRDLARQLLSAADLWLFVTTAARYADAVPWDLLNQASERGTSVAIVLDRVPPEAKEPIRQDLLRMLAEQGLSTAPLFAVPETTTDASGLLPAEVVGDIRMWLRQLAEDAQARQNVIRRTLDGALASLEQRGHEMLVAAESQVTARDALAHEVTGAYVRHLEEVADGLADGSLLRGEVLARWQEFVGTGEMFKQFDAGVSKVRDRVTGLFRTRVEAAAPAQDLGQALQSGVANLVTAHLESAALDSSRAWRADPGGRPLLNEVPYGGQAAPESLEAVERLVREWQGDVLALVRDEAGGRRKTARFLALGVNGVAVLLMVITFASTYGLSGAEIGIAGGSAVLGQRLLEAVFGDQAVRTLAERSRTMLITRIDGLFADDQQRYLDVLDHAGVPGDSAHQLRTALDAVEAAR